MPCYHVDQAIQRFHNCTLPCLQATGPLLMVEDIMFLDADVLPLQRLSCIIPLTEARVTRSFQYTVNMRELL